MKKFLATTAIALVVANGAFAASHETETDTSSDSTMTENSDSTMNSDSNMETDTSDSMENAAEDTMDSAEQTMENAGETAEESMDAAGEEVDETMNSAEQEMDSTADEMTDAMSPMDGYEQLMNADVTAEQLEDAGVYGSDNEEVGEISDLVIADDGMIQQVIVDVGGFLGLGEKPVALEFDAVTIMQEVDGEDIRVSIEQTEEQLEEMPEYEAEM